MSAAYRVYWYARCTDCNIAFDVLPLGENDVPDPDRAGKPINCPRCGKRVSGWAANY